MKRFFILLTVAVLLLPLFSALGEDVEEVLIEAETESSETPAAEEGDVFIPSLGSPFTADLGSAYWTTPMDISDEAAVWDMLMQPIVVIDKGNVNKKVKSKNRSQQTKEQIYMYQEPNEKSKIVGEISNLSQGVRVIEHLDGGWSLVECYSSSFFSKPATKIQAWNILVHGYIQTAYLKTVQPTDELALVVDKLAQRVYVFQKGKLLTSLLCSTGLVQWNGKKYQPYNETRSGEFLLINMTGQLTSDRLICSYAIRFNGGDEIHEVPHQVNKDGTFNYKTTDPKLGTKSSHGCIRVQHNKTPEGVNMAWIYDLVKSQDLCGKVKIVVWEDWQGRQLPTPSPDTVLYYNPDRGQYYHRTEHCYMARKVTFTPFLYSKLEEDGFKKLLACPYCVPERREAEIRAVNETYAPGGDHEELLNSLRQNYYDYLAK